MTTIDQIKRKLGVLEEQHEQQTDNRVLVCVPDNGRGPTGAGRQGNVIIYDAAHPAESFIRPEERRGKPPGPCPV